MSSPWSLRRRSPSPVRFIAATAPRARGWRPGRAWQRASPAPRYKLFFRNRAPKRRRVIRHSVRIKSYPTAIEQTRAEEGRMTAVTFDTLTKGLIRASSVILYAHDRDSRHRGKGVCTAGRGALADPCGITGYSLTRPDPFSARVPAGITSAPCAFPPIPLFAQANYRLCPTGGGAGRWILASECREVYALADADRQARRDLAAPRAAQLHILAEPALQGAVYVRTRTRPAASPWRGSSLQNGG